MRHQLRRWVIAVSAWVACRRARVPDRRTITWALLRWLVVVLRVLLQMLRLLLLLLLLRLLLRGVLLLGHRGRRGKACWGRSVERAATSKVCRHGGASRRRRRRRGDPRERGVVHIDGGQAAVHADPERARTRTGQRRHRRRPSQGGRGNGRIGGGAGRRGRLGIRANLDGRGAGRVERPERRRVRRRGRRVLGQAGPASGIVRRGPVPPRPLRRRIQDGADVQGLVPRPWGLLRRRRGYSRRSSGRRTEGRACRRGRGQGDGRGSRARGASCGG